MYNWVIDMPTALYFQVQGCLWNTFALPIAYYLC